MASEIELAAMRQAILLASLGLATASPNPPVGCVILDPAGAVAGTGFHRRKGEAHAEVNALAMAGEAARGGTAVVTLEPCNHVGVTPACRQELLDAGIARVVIGVTDPTSRGDGGAAVLAHEGVDVEIGVLPDEILTVLRPWLTATTLRRPYVTRAVTAEDTCQDERAGALLHHLRGGADTVIVGSDVFEGIQGGHSEEHFSLPRPPGPTDDPTAWLIDAFQNGTRSLLLLGGSWLVDELHASNLIDEWIVLLPRDTTTVTSRHELLQALPAFAITAVTSAYDGVVIRSKARSGHG